MVLSELPIYIASGILLAAMILFGIRSAFTFFHRGEVAVGVLVGVVFCTFGAIVMIAGLY